ncbi:MAG: magnesium and cobalt transport protein CorA [Burkholderiaceae bacterium]
MQMIVNVSAYEGGKRFGDIALDDISDLLGRPQTFVWVGLYEPDDALLAKMKEEFGLHELAVEDARNAHQRPKIETYGNSLFIVLKTAQLKDRQISYGETHLFVGPNFLVSVRHGDSAGYTVVRERCESTASLLAKGPGFALYAILDFVADNYQPIIEQLEADFDVLEEGIFKSDFDKLVIGRMYELKRALLDLRNAALPVGDIANELMRFHDDMIPKELRAYFRDVKDHVARLVGMADNMREMLNSAMQVNLALVGVSQNEVVKRLAGWGAILAIPTVVFSLEGMNFKNMPELSFTYGYPVTVGLTALACVLLYRRLQKTGWI